MTYLIGDPGSTHDGSLDKAKELVRIGADIGLDACKFQLLYPEQCQSGNIMLPWEWVPELIDLGGSLGVEVFASVFGDAGIDHMWGCGAKAIKFAHSQQAIYDSNDLAGRFENIYVSRSYLEYKQGDKARQLLCFPLYPVPFVPNFDGCFPPFSGFSSHCLGIEQELNAVKAGAQYLEFHFRGPWDSDCPDARFAKHPTVAAELVNRIRQIEMNRELSAVTESFWSGKRKRLDDGE